MKHLESKIRDYLASNLYFLSDEFELIETEFKLANAFGTRGYIDILAQDIYHNLVIVEVKRSNQAARQAIHEVLKYAGLLKQTHGIKESEIRICIVSTDWDELLVPFSEFSRVTNYPLEGFKISLDSNYIPVSKELVTPLKNPVERNISHNQLVFLYQSHKAMVDSVEMVSRKVKAVGILDFVLIEMFCGETENNVIYPFAIYLAIQRYAKNHLEKIIVDHPKLPNDLDDSANCSGSELELIHLYEQMILGEIEVGISDTREVGYPNALLAMINAQGWYINKITRYGSFSSDPRSQKDDILITEVQGTKGSGDTKYSNYTTSRFKLRLQEIESQVSKYLWVNEYNNNWLSHVEFAFGKLKHHESTFELAIDIYNPKTAILESLYQMSNYDKFKADHPLQFLPIYVLQIHFSDDEMSSIVYIGKIKWNGKKNSLDNIVKQVLNNDVYSYFFASHIGANPLTEVLIMDSLGFEYSTDVFSMKRGEIQNINALENDIDGTVHLIPYEKGLYLEDFLYTSTNFLRELTQLYDEFVWVS